MGFSSPFSDGPSVLKLAPGSTPYHHALILGRVVAIYYALQPPTMWPAHRYRWLKVAIHLGLAEAVLSWMENGKPCQLILRGEQACFIGANEEHSIDWKSEAPLVWLFVDEVYLQALGLGPVSGIECVDLVELIRRDLGLYRLAALFREACLEQTKRVPEYVEAKGTLLATRLLYAHLGGAMPAVNGQSGISTPSLEKMQSYLQAQLAVPLDYPTHVPLGHLREDALENAALAKAAGMGESHFIRQFKARMKKTPQQHVMQCRLDKAEELILTRHFSPKQAAEAAGFCEPGHFYRCFRKRYKQSPHQLLKQPRP